MTITGPLLSDPEAINTLSAFGRFSLGVTASIFYFFLGVALALSIGLAVGGIVGFFRSVYYLFRSRTAWFGCLTFASFAFFNFTFPLVGIFMLVGVLGDKTGYLGQWVFFLGAIFGLLLGFWIPQQFWQLSKKLAETRYLSPFGSFYGGWIWYASWSLGLFLIYHDTILHIDIGSLAFALTVPIFLPQHVLSGTDSWLPLILFVGGPIIGSFLILQCGKSSADESKPEPTDANVR